MRLSPFLLCLAAANAHAAFLPGMDGGRALYLDLIQKEAALHGVPPALADAVAMVETGYRPDAVGSSGEIGLMQIMPGTARQLGYAGSLVDLFQPATNINLGVEYLSRAWAASGGDICRALMKYRAGLAQEYMTPLSQTYCARAMGWLASTGNTLTGNSLAKGMTVPDLAPGQSPQSDPHVLAIVPALAAQASQIQAQHGIVVVNGPPSLSVLPLPAYHVPPNVAARMVSLQARQDPHVRRMPRDRAERASAAIAAALSNE
jgi:hypothetical protein